MKTKLFLTTFFLGIAGLTNVDAQTQTTPFNNSFGGNYNLRAVTGVYNNAFGAYTLSNGTDPTPNGTLSGGYNNAFGGWALLNNTSGSGNNVIGYRAMMSNLTGGGNSVIGMDALKSSAAGYHNVVIGNQALYNNNPNTGNTGVDGYNIAIGVMAGWQNVSGVGNIFLGSYAGYNELGSNKLYIHNNSNTTPLIYGDFATGNLRFNGNVEVNGNVANTSGLKFTDLTNASPSIANTANKVLSVNGTGDVILVDDKIGTGGTDTSIYANDGVLATDRVVTMSNNDLIFNTSGNTTSTGGRIYIGNTNAFTSANFPITTGDYRLYVEGGVLTEKVKVALRSSVNWADYVFANDYKLMPLKEVEAFVKENKHLPGVASAENLAKEGLDLGEMQAKQMEKIEELTLYAIEQNKQIENQNKEINELKVLVRTLIEKNK